MPEVPKVPSGPGFGQHPISKVTEAGLGGSFHAVEHAMRYTAGMTLFFYGPNSYARRQQLSQMMTAYVAKAGSDFGLERIDGAAVKARDLIGLLQAMPFMANSRLVVIDGVAANKAVAAKLPELLALVPVSTVTVFVEREIDQRTAAFKALSRADKVMKFEPLAGPALAAWVRHEVGELGGTADASAVRQLIELAGDDQWRLSSEVNKLVHYEPAITSANVKAMVAPSIQQSIFELVEAMTSGRVKEALATYGGLLRARESEHYVLTMVQWQLRNLLLAKTAPPGTTQAELAKAAGMSPYVAGKMLSAQRRYQDGALRRAVVAAANCEQAIKTGQLAAEAAVEQLIYQVAAAAPGGR